MRDPFPISFPPSIADTFLVTKLADTISLPALSLHLHEVLISAAAYHVVCFYASPIFSKAVFPKTYPHLDQRTKLNWDVHVVSMVQSITINVLGFWIILYDEERSNMDWRERVWEYDGALGMLAALAAGYFLWDFWLCLRYVKIFGPGLLAHATSALAVYMFGFRPIIFYYAPTFILFELSSPFLNIHWFLDKVHMTGSNAQLVNGIILMSTFAGSRLIWGSYNCFRVFPDLWKVLQYQSTEEGKMYLAALASDKIINASSGGVEAIASAKRTVPRIVPPWLAGIYILSYITLMALNFVWFGKMVETIRRRFDPPLGTRGLDNSKEKVEFQGEGIVGNTGNDASNARMGKSVNRNGSTVLEVQKTEVVERKARRRPPMSS